MVGHQSNGKCRISSFVRPIGTENAGIINIIRLCMCLCYQTGYFFVIRITTFTCNCYWQLIPFDGISNKNSGDATMNRTSQIWTRTIWPYIIRRIRTTARRNACCTYLKHLTRFTLNSIFYIHSAAVAERFRSQRRVSAALFFISFYSLDLRRMCNVFDAAHNVVASFIECTVRSVEINSCCETNGAFSSVSHHDMLTLYGWNIVIQPWKIYEYEYDEKKIKTKSYEVKMLNSLRHTQGTHPIVVKVSYRRRSFLPIPHDRCVGICYCMFLGRTRTLTKCQHIAIFVVRNLKKLSAGGSSPTIQEL